jgi:hypothetical protein
MSHIVVEEDGTIRFIYSDDLRGLLQQGAASITRASHVEPCGLGWTADMGPVNGPILGPYTTRAEALEAEVNYLHNHVL